MKLNYLKKIHKLKKDCLSVLPPEKAESLLAEINLNEEDLVRGINQLLSYKTRIQAMINKLPGYTERMVMEMRYINFMKWEELAEELSFSLRSVMRIHSKALEMLDRMQCI